MPKADDCKNCKLCRLNQLFVLNHNSRSCNLKPVENSPVMASEPKAHDSGRILRLATLWLWLPAFAVLLPHGILTGQVVPTIGIIPMTLSAVATVFQLFPSHKPRRGCSLDIMIDFCLALSHISVLIATWVLIAEYDCWYGHRYQSYNDRCKPRMVMLGTTGTMFMIIDFLIHSWMVLREIPTLLSSIRWQRVKLPAKSCPHCNGDLEGGSKGRKQPMRAESYDYSERDDGYSPLHAAETSEVQKVDGGAEFRDGRPSTDDETARLMTA